MIYIDEGLARSSTDHYNSLEEETLIEMNGNDNWSDKADWDSPPLIYRGYYTFPIYPQIFRANHLTRRVLWPNLRSADPMAIHPS